MGFPLPSNDVTIESSRAPEALGPALVLALSNQLMVLPLRPPWSKHPFHLSYPEPAFLAYNQITPLTHS